jgi:hypothetical protein
MESTFFIEKTVQNLLKFITDSVSELNEKECLFYFVGDSGSIHLSDELEFEDEIITDLQKEMDKDFSLRNIGVTTLVSRRERDAFVFWNKIKKKTPNLYPGL